MQYSTSITKERGFPALLFLYEIMVAFPEFGAILIMKYYVLKEKLL